MQLPQQRINDRDTCTHSLSTAIGFSEAELNIVAHGVADPTTDTPASARSPLHSTATWWQIIQLQLSQGAALLYLVIWWSQNNTTHMMAPLHKYIHAMFHG